MLLGGTWKNEVCFWQMSICTCNCERTEKKRLLVGSISRGPQGGAVRCLLLAILGELWWDIEFWRNSVQYVLCCRLIQLSDGHSDQVPQRNLSANLVKSLSWPFLFSPPFSPLFPAFEMSKPRRINGGPTDLRHVDRQTQWKINDVIVNGKSRSESRDNLTKLLWLIS